MTSSSRRCTRAADAESSSALMHTGEGSLPCCRAAQCPALPCSTQLCSTGSPKTADCGPALLESSARTSFALAERAVYQALTSMSTILNLLSVGQSIPAGMQGM